ncbi:unnamed protein product, partial [Rotaria sordida]
GEDQNGLSDPYCKVSVIHVPNNQDDSNALTSSSSSISASASPNRPKRSSSLFSCASASSSKNKSKAPKKKDSRRSNKSNNQRRSIDGSPEALSNKSKTLRSVIYRTQVRSKTINPEWNEHFEFEIENLQEQNLLIRIFDSDRGQAPRFKTVVQQKRGFSHKLFAIRNYITTGEIEDDFLGQVSLDIKSLATCDREQWFPLTGLNQNRLSNSRSRGEILLGLKVHFKLPCSIVLFVDVKKARNLLGEDQNGLSDPYCKVSVIHVPNNEDDSNALTSSSSSISSSSSTSRSKRSSSLFSRATASSSKNISKPLTITHSRRSDKSSSRSRSADCSSIASSNNSETLKSIVYCTKVQPKTINPEWNEHFEFEIENLQEQQLHIRIFDSDRDQVPGFTTVVQQKRGFSRKLLRIRNYITTGEIEDDFLGQVSLDIKSLATCDREQWFPLTGLNQNRLSNSRSRGEILLGLKVHFKLDDKSTKPRGHASSSGTVLEFRRRHSSSSCANPKNSSIILRSSIFRQNFRSLAMQARGYPKPPIFEENQEGDLSRIDSCLTPATDLDLPLLIEEYHQLTRIAMLHQLEDARDASNKNQSNNLVIDWNGSLNELSYNVLTQFRILYNISVLSQAFIQEGDLSRTDSCLTPVSDSKLPLLIEEYHQLTLIVMLHQLEDARDASNKNQSNNLVIDWNGSLNELSYNVLTQFRILYNISVLSQAFINKNQSNNLVIDWNGSLNELSYNVLTQFRILYNISVLSQAFIHLLVIMELRCSEDYAVFISQGVIEAYLKIFIEQVRQRTDVNDLDVTDYEKTVFKDIFYLFIDHYKKRVRDDAQWFLPSRENLSSITSIFETIRALHQLKICSNEATIKTHLEEIIKTRLQTDINDLFSIHSFVFNDKNDIQLNTVREFLEFVKKLAESMSIINEYQQLFSSFNISYIKTCFFETNSAGDRLTELTKCLLKNMTEYVQKYSKPMVKATSSIYDPNLIQSSSLLLNLYLYLQTIITSLRETIGKREWYKHAFKLKLTEYRQWFSPKMEFLLEGIVAQIRQIMERAVEDDNKISPDEDIMLCSQSSMATTNLCIKLCQEWESIDYPDINIRYTALIKLTNTICEQCQHYARRTAHKLSENKYFTDLNRTRSFNVSKKLCILVNDIEYVKQKLLSSLPDLLNFTTVVDKMNENYDSTDFQQTKVTLERLIATAEHEMNDVITLIFERVATLFFVSLKDKISKYYEDEKRKKVDSMKDINQYIDQEILRKLYGGLESVQYSRVACAIHLKALQCLRELLPLQEPPDFYERVLQSFDRLAIYFESVCREEQDIPGPPCEEITTFRRRLQQFALSTEQLQLIYFREITQTHSPHERLTNNGIIVFRTAYEIVNELITIYVHILSCRDLPKMDVFGASDPYVILELLPSTLYPQRPKED